MLRAFTFLEIIDMDLFWPIILLFSLFPLIFLFFCPLFFAFFWIFGYFQIVCLNSFLALSFCIMYYVFNVCFRDYSTYLSIQSLLRVNMVFISSEIEKPCNHMDPFTLPPSFYSCYIEKPTRQTVL